MLQPKNFPGLPQDFVYDTDVRESLDHENTIFFNIFKKKTETFKRGLLMVHGHGEHGGRYLHFPHYMHSQYDYFVAIDLRGHGRSEGTRGHVGHFDEYVDDLFLGLQYLKEKLGESTPVDLFAHSMGGLVALRAFLKQPHLQVQNVVISAPLLGLSFPIPTLKELSGRVLAKVWPTFQMETGLDPKKVSHDLEVVKTYQEDRLVHSKATPAFYFGMLDAVKELQGEQNHQREGLQIPDTVKILFQVPLEDGIVSAPAALTFFEKRLRSSQKTLKTYPGFFHEIYNEVQKDLIFQDWIDWLKG